MSDDRVQAIRCCSCHRLRPHPRGDTPATLWCFCGGTQFEPSGVFPDEEAWAIQIYDKELKERGLWKHT